MLTLRGRRGRGEQATGLLDLEGAQLGLEEVPALGRRGVALFGSPRVPRKRRDTVVGKMKTELVQHSELVLRIDLAALRGDAQGGEDRVVGGTGSRRQAKDHQKERRNDSVHDGSDGHGR